jgi:hypothetical protein
MHLPLSDFTFLGEAQKVGNNTRSTAIPNKPQTGIGCYLRPALPPSAPARGSAMKSVPGRRFALMTMGAGMAAGAAGVAALHDGAVRAAEPSLLPPEAKSLEELTARLSRAPRRRNFKTVPMILNDPDQWDHAALSEVIAYRAAPKQVWDNTGIASPWLKVMRNSLNAQVWSGRSLRWPRCRPAPQQRCSASGTGAWRRQRCSRSSLDNVLLKRNPGLAHRTWFRWLAGSLPLPLTDTAFRNLGLAVLAVVLAFDVATYSYYRGSVVTLFHGGPVSPTRHHFALSNGALLPDGGVKFHSKFILLRKPSYLISCSQSLPAGASSARRVSGLIHFGGPEAVPTSRTSAHGAVSASGKTSHQVREWTQTGHSGGNLIHGPEASRSS